MCNGTGVTLWTRERLSNFPIKYFIYRIGRRCIYSRYNTATVYCCDVFVERTVQCALYNYCMVQLGLEVERVQHKETRCCL